MEMSIIPIPKRKIDVSWLYHPSVSQNFFEWHTGLVGEAPCNKAGHFLAITEESGPPNRCQGRLLVTYEKPNFQLPVHGSSLLSCCSFRLIVGIGGLNSLHLQVIKSLIHGLNNRLQLVFN